jgi:Uma2 family endonuclease
MRMASPIYYTAEMARALPHDGNRYEVVHGELLVTPAPRPWHQVLVQRLLVALHAYLDRYPAAGHVLHAPADISWTVDNLVQPDVFVVPLAEARTLDWTRMRRLRLVAEVLSPASTRADRFPKRRLYQDGGVPVYWIVDGDERVVEVWTPETAMPRLERERLVWHPAEAPEPFTLGLGDLFRPI